MSGEIVIRECAPADAEMLSSVGQATFLEAFAGILPGPDIRAHCANQHSVAVYRDWLQTDTSKLWIAEAEVGRAGVGYLALTPPKLPIAEPRPDDLEVKRVYILHRFHGFGIGRRLMDAATEYARTKRCRRLLLGVYSKNHEAIAFYEKLGYVRAGVRKFRVGHNDYDDLILTIDL
jgi:diamine N-acetyltransferase